MKERDNGWKLRKKSSVQGLNWMITTNLFSDYSPVPFSVLEEDGGSQDLKTRVRIARTNLVQIAETLLNIPKN